jgi:phosphoserine phosphatase
VSLIVDLCGTLVCEDTTRGFVKSLRLRGWRYAVVRFGDAAAVRKASSLFRRDFSRRLVIYALRGIPRCSLESAAREYVEKIIGESLNRRVAEAVNAEMASGGAVFLATASLELVAQEVGRRFGLSGVVSSRLGYDSTGRCTGKLVVDLTGKKWGCLSSAFPNLLQGRVAVYTDNPDDSDLMGKATEVWFIAPRGVRPPRALARMPNVYVVND